MSCKRECYSLILLNFIRVIDQDNSEHVVRVLASKSFAAVQTASGKVHSTIVNVIVEEEIV